MMGKNKFLAGMSIAPLIQVCFFFSGMTGLIYEILWTRMIVRIIGGAHLCGKYHPDRFYGRIGIRQLYRRQEN